MSQSLFPVHYLRLDHLLYLIYFYKPGESVHHLMNVFVLHHQIRLVFRPHEDVKKP